MNEGLADTRMDLKIKNRQLIFTVKDRCRVCYTCVRGCPCKAIRIVNGQAEVMSQRCIGCGNCVNVCSQKAKMFLDTKESVKNILRQHHSVVAMVAPSFPAEFQEIDDYRQLVSAVRKLGFAHVTEVAFGADLVANEYRKVYNNSESAPHIVANCPTILAYVEKYYPQLVDKIARIPSPMVAMARVIRKKFGEGVKVVFIGPCFSKKNESDELDEVLTFTELRELLKEMKIDFAADEISEFDPPVGGCGAIFPVSRGMLRTINMTEEIADDNIIIAEGNPSFQEAIREFEEGYISGQHLDLLACDGCIMGPGMSRGGQRFSRQKAVSSYVIRQKQHVDRKAMEESFKEFASIDMTQQYEANDQRLEMPASAKIVDILEKMGKYNPEDYLDCGACGYSTCWEHAVAISKGLAENEMCLPYTIEKLHKYNNQLMKVNEEMTSMQKVLKQKEKLAGMGQISAGIAHELNNPLGVIIMFSNLLLEDCPPDSPMQHDIKLIVEQANRCKKIVSGLLSFSRKDQVSKSAVDVVKMVHKSIHSLIVPDNIDIQVESDIKDPVVMLDEEQIIQVFSNLIKNGIEAMPGGGKIKISIGEKLNDVSIKVSDTGTGISKENLEKIFEPFFTTKEKGKGTGLGLPTIYGIIKMHKGKIDVVSNDNPALGPTGTTFKIRLPRLYSD